MSNTSKKPKEFRLVQAFFTPKLISHLDTWRFGDLFSPRYMGAAEYEGPAVENFLRALDEVASPEPIRSWVPFKKPTPVPTQVEFFEAEIDGMVIYVMFDTRHGTLASTLAGIKSVAARKADLKRNADFPPKGERPSAAWAEIRLGVFWAFADFREHLAGMIHREVQYLDKQREYIKSREAAKS